MRHSVPGDDRFADLVPVSDHGRALTPDEKVSVRRIQLEEGRQQRVSVGAILVIGMPGALRRPVADDEEPAVKHDTTLVIDEAPDQRVQSEVFEELREQPVGSGAVAGHPEQGVRVVRRHEESVTPRHHARPYRSVAFQRRRVTRPEEARSNVIDKYTLKVGQRSGIKGQGVRVEPSSERS
jgi:hypothetical protein